MQLDILHDSQSFMVISKPYGLVVNQSLTSKDSLQNYLSSLSYPLSSNTEMRNGIVHRLDKETSGVLIVAKTSDSFFKLQAQFAERKVSKHYLSLVHEKLLGEGTISAAIGRNPKKRINFTVLDNGREAVTKYKSQKVYEKDGYFYTLVDFYPETGRTHQIRLHAKHIHHPIVSDSKYTGRKMYKKDIVWCKRLFLHALEISFFDVDQKKMITVKDKLPSDLNNCLSMLS